MKRGIGGGDWCHLLCSAKCSWTRTSGTTAPRHRSVSNGHPRDSAPRRKGAEVLWGGGGGQSVTAVGGDAPADESPCPIRPGSGPAPVCAPHDRGTGGALARPAHSPRAPRPHNATCRPPHKARQREAVERNRAPYESVDATVTNRKQSKRTAPPTPGSALPPSDAVVGTLRTSRSWP